MQLDIRTATISTRCDFASIVEGANDWQKARGSEGWSGQFDDAWMLPRIARQELYLAYEGENPVSAFRLLWEDRPFWGDREHGESIYLHTFAVKRANAGCGIGSAVIESVVNIARRAGRSNVRLDCFSFNERLTSFYEKNGFSCVGSKIINQKSLNLMERAI